MLSVRQSSLMVSPNWASSANKSSELVPASPNPEASDAETGWRLAAQSLQHRCQCQFQGLRSIKSAS